MKCLHLVLTWLKSWLNNKVGSPWDRIPDSEAADLLSVVTEPSPGTQVLLMCWWWSTALHLSITAALPLRPMGLNVSGVAACRDIEIHMQLQTNGDGLNEFWEVLLQCFEAHSACWRRTHCPIKAGGWNTTSRVAWSWWNGELKFDHFCGSMLNTTGCQHTNTLEAVCNQRGGDFCPSGISTQTSESIFGTQVEPAASM